MRGRPAKPTASRNVTRTGLAEIFGVAMPTVDSWIRGGCPYVKKGGRGIEWEFDTAAVARWREQKAVADATGDAPVEEAELKRRKLSAETAKAELELAKARGLVAPLDQVERVLAKVFAEVRANMRNIPSGMVSVLIGETDERRFKRVLMEEIDRSLEALANMNFSDADEEEEADDEGDE